jgi:hypothetical protein
MTKRDNDPSQPNVWQIGQQNTRFQEWRNELAQLNEKIRATRIKEDQALMDGIVNATGLDLVKISQDVRKQLDDEYDSLDLQKKRLREEAEGVIAKESREFKVALARYIESGFGNLLDKAHHNPSLRMKLARRWEGEANPPSGVHGGGTGFGFGTGWASDYRFDVIEDPSLGEAVNTIHPNCFARVNIADRYGSAEAWVTQTLIYEHAAPAGYSLLTDRVWIYFSAFGYGASDPSNGIYIPSSMLIGAGGYAQLLLTVRVEQVVRAGGREDLLVHEVVNNEVVAGTYSGGAISFWTPWDRPDHDFGPIRVTPDHEPFHRPIAIYRASTGGPVNVVVEFKCIAHAEKQNASAELDFNGTGQNITVHEVILQGDTTIR